MTEQNGYLCLRHLNKAFGDVQAVNDISIDIKKGELVSFIGPSGCGKTTLLRAIGGFHELDSGEIILDGERIDHLPPERRFTGMVFQNYALFPHMTVYKNVEYGLQVQKLSAEERRKKVEKALAQVRLERYGNRRPNELSGGQQQRVAIARCLVLEPKVLLLDEPLSNLDANLRMIMREEIRRLKEELDLTIIFVTHDQEEALSISDRVIVLDKGTIQQIDTPENIYKHPANEFVAKFVGHANLFHGNIDKNGSSFTFTTDDFSIKGLEQPNKEQEQLTMMVRPEQIEICEDSAIKGEVVRDIYNGNYVRYHIKVGSTIVLVDSFIVGPSTLFKRGDLIGISFPNNPHYI